MKNSSLLRIVYGRSNLPNTLIGDFAFLIWDKRKNTLFCARDALGVKQLYYCQTNHSLIIATEISQLLAHPEVPRDLDEIFIGNFLVFNWVEPERTMFAQIKAVPAATCIYSENGKTQFVKYWQTRAIQNIRYQSDIEYSEHFLELFIRAISDRLRTTREKVGILMSGGLDSCSVAAVIKKKIISDQSPHSLKAYSIIYDNFPLADESAFIRVMEKELGLDIEYILADEFWFLRDKLAFTPSLETPMMGTEELNRLIHQRLQSNQIQVLLSGQAGDHLLTGSPRVYTDRIARGDLSVLREMYQHSNLWGVDFFSMIYRYLLRPFAPDSWVYFYRGLKGQKLEPQFPTWLRRDFIKRIALRDQSEIPYSEMRHQDRARFEVEKQIKAIPFFTRNQDASIRKFQLDPRPPYADRRLAEFVIGIPQEQHYSGGLWKRLLRRSMSGILPETIRNRSGKASLEPFYHFSIREKERQHTFDLFNDPISGIMGIIDKDELDKAFSSYCSKKNVQFDFSTWITTNPWHLICLELWLRNYYGIISR